jgi:hypothetical protein
MLPARWVCIALLAIGDVTAMLDLSLQHPYVRTKVICPPEGRHLNYFAGVAQKKGQSQCPKVAQLGR